MIFKNNNFLNNDSLQINGFFRPGFEDVYYEFKNNFISRKELGAALCVYHRGEKVVDIWGGISNVKNNLPWAKNTMVPFFSATKGIAALCFAKLYSEGKIDYNRRVADYWDRFAKNGKEIITVGQLLSHQSGLCLWNGNLKNCELSKREVLLEKLENAKPFWTPGDFSGYSAGIIGHYMGELVRRIDEKHRTLGQYFQEEIAKPLELEFYIGLPDSIQDQRIALIQMNNPIKRLLMIGSTPKGLRRAIFNPNSIFVKSITQVKGYNINSRNTWKIEEPSGNGIGTARSIAKLYGIFSTGGKELGLDEESLFAYSDPAVKPRFGTVDRVMGVPLYYRNGFLKNGVGSTPFANDFCFGFGGASGSMAFADPVNEIGYCYVPNKMSYDFPDSREIGIQKKLYECVVKLKKPL